MVHPHMRGEHQRLSCSDSRGNGSSPHAWGTLERRQTCLRPCRFIPTCVGNTLISLSEKPPCTVHPHMRGEHDSSVEAQVEGDGSSPHAWGTRRVPYRVATAHR